MGTQKNALELCAVLLRHMINGSGWLKAFSTSREKNYKWSTCRSFVGLSLRITIHEWGDDSGGNTLCASDTLQG